jgi:hypothetical protein
MMVTRKTMLASLFALILFLIPAAMNSTFVSAQPETSSLKMVSLNVDGKYYDLPYLMEDAELIDVEFNRGTIILNIESDQQNAGFIEMAFPVDLIRQLHPQLSGDRNLDSLEVYVSSKSLEQTLAFAGSRVTISGEFPRGTEQIYVSPTLLAAQVPLLILDVPEKWGNSPGDEIEIRAVATGIDTEQELPISVALVDSLNKQIAMTTVTAKVDEEFTISMEIPRESRGGFVDVIGTMDLSNHPDVNGYDYIYLDSPGFFKIRTEGNEQAIHISSNSSVYEPFLMKENKLLGLLVSGQGEGTTHTTLITPRAVIDGGLASTADWDGFESDLTSNSTHSVVEMRYPSVESASLIQITGTTVMPEFGALAAGVAAIALGVVIITFKISSSKLGPYR